MAATPLTATVRYAVKGTRKIYWLTACSNYLSPTRAELNAGVDLTAEIESMTGFTVSSDTIDVPDLSTRFTAKIPGPISAADSTITFHASNTSADVRATLPRDTAGFVVCLWEGDTAALKMDCFPVKVGSASLQTGIDGSGLIDIQFSITKVPQQNITVPA
jgi:hypothetical protein